MKRREIIGKTFGNLTVQKEWKGKGGRYVCLCKCACGGSKVVEKCNLTGGRTKSCGCLEGKNRKRFNDIAGMRFGRLMAECPTEGRVNGSIVWKCRCDCGATAEIPSAGLVRGAVKSCGCIRREKREIAGKQFGRLTALYPDEQIHSKRNHWICRCTCGNLTSVSLSNLKSGHTRSCGCLRKENVLHGGGRSRRGTYQQ